MSRLNQSDHERAVLCMLCPTCDAQPSVWCQRPGGWAKTLHSEREGWLRRAVELDGWTRLIDRSATLEHAALIAELRRIGRLR